MVMVEQTPILTSGADATAFMAKECHALAAQYQWRYPGTTDYFAGILGAECGRCLVYASAEFDDSTRAYDTRAFISAWCANRLHPAPGEDATLDERLATIRSTLIEMEASVCGLQESQFADRTIADIEFSGDLHVGSVSIRLLLSDGSTEFFKVNGASNYAFVADVKRYLESISPLDPSDWFSLPPFRAVGGHLLTRDVTQATAESLTFAGDAGGGLSSWYRQAGTLLAFSALVGLTDLHVENIITAGDRLFLIDVDTLLHPRMSEPSYPNAAMAEVDRTIFFSILGSGLLPFGTSREAGGDRPRDIAGLTATEVSTSVVTLDEAELGSGGHVWQLKPLTLDALRSPNLPASVGDGKRSLREHAAEVTSAFEAVMSAARDHLGELTALLRERSRGVNVRCLVRDTASYSLLVNLASSPLPESRARAADALHRHASGIDERIVASEIEQVQAGHIPVFWWGAHEVPYGLDVSPIDAHCRRLTPDWLARQGDLLCFFLSEKKAMTVGGAPFRELLSTHPGASSALPRLVAELVDDLSARAFRAEDGTLNYASLTVDAADELAAVSLGDELYSGLLGVLFAARGVRALEPSLVPEWFLAALEKSTAGFPAEDLVHGYYQSSAAHLAALPSAHALDLDTPAAEAGDFLTGLPSVVAYLESASAPRDVQDEAVRRILAALVEAPDHTLCWCNEAGTSFASFAHGNSGIVYALSRWVRSLGPQEEVPEDFLEEVTEAIDRLLRYEFHHLPQAEEGLYLDSRGGKEPSPNWCHSVSGMLLTRVEVLGNPALCAALPGDTVDRLRREASKQCAWLDENWGNTLSYGNCHGVAGNLAILRWASASLGIPTSTDIPGVFSDLLEWGEKSAWGNTVGDPICNVSLMNGLWGVAYSAAYCCSDSPTRPPFWAVAGCVGEE